MTASVLDQMTAGIMNRKAAAAAGLTPVGGETGTTVAAVAARVPKDVPGSILSRETLQDQARDLRRYAAELLKIADGLDVLIGEPEAVATQAELTAATERILQEREADRKAADRAAADEGDKRAEKRVTAQEKFDADIAAKAEAAQAAVYAAADDDPAPEPAPTGGWTCPTHGQANLSDLTSRAGRKYRACGNCDQFEPKG